MATITRKDGSRLRTTLSRRQVNGMLHVAEQRGSVAMMPDENRDLRQIDPGHVAGVGESPLDTLRDLVRHHRTARTIRRMLAEEHAATRDSRTR